jgi:hypothetical protein
MPTSLIEQIKTSPSLKVKPGLSDASLRLFEENVGRRLPVEILELLRFCGGAVTGWGDTVDFTDLDVPSRNATPGGVCLMTDELGNSWVVDILSSGAWDHVLYWSHDPPVMVKHFATLNEFIQLAGRVKKAEQLVDEEAVASSYNNPGKDVRTACSADASLRAFSELVPDEYRLFDLRQGSPEHGFRWDPDFQAITRFGDELVFALPPREKSKGLFAFLFDK